MRICGHKLSFRLPVLFRQPPSNLPDGPVALRQQYISPHMKNSLRHFAYRSPNFYRGQKVKNWASIFDTSRLAFEALSFPNGAAHRKFKKERNVSVDNCSKYLLGHFAHILI